MSDLGEKFRSYINKSVQVLPEKWYTARFQTNSFQPPFFQGQLAFDEAIYELTEIWRNIQDDFEHDILKVIQEIPKPDFKISSALMTAIEDQWKMKFLEISKNLSMKFDLCLEEQSKYSTLN